METLLFLLYSALFAALIYSWHFFRKSGIRSLYLVAVFVLKLGIGIGLAWIYTDHYTNRGTGDTFRFFDDAQLLYSSLEDSPLTYLKMVTGLAPHDDPDVQTYYNRMTHLNRKYYNGFINDNATIIRINALVMLFSFGYYKVHIAFWCFFSMIGLTALFRVFAEYFPRKKWAMFMAVYLLPTVLFWSSGVLKEPLLVLGLGLFTAGFIRIIYGDQHASDYWKALFGFLLLLFVKGYVLQCLAPAIAGLLIAKLFHGRHFWWWFGLPHFLIILLIFVGPHLNESLNVSRLMRQKQEAFYNVAEMSKSGSVVDLPKIEKPVDILLNAPVALAQTYLRPWPWNWSRLTYMPAAIENLLLLILILLTLWNFRLPHRQSVPFLAFAMSFVFSLGVLTGEVVPVLGAVVRYKLPSLIFLFVMLFILTDHNKLQRRFPIITKLLNRL